MMDSLSFGIVHACRTLRHSKSIRLKVQRGCTHMLLLTSLMAYELVMVGNHWVRTT